MIAMHQPHAAPIKPKPKESNMTIAINLTAFSDMS